MAVASVGGITLEYDVHGEGEPVVLIMGLATQMIAWSTDFVQGLVERGFMVVRHDNRDIGMSGKTVGPRPTRQDVLRALMSKRLAKADYLLSDMAADTVGLLDHLGIDRAHVVGASMGAMIAQEIAIGHPQRVRSLTSMMSNTGNRVHGRPAPAMLSKLRSNLLAPPPRGRDAIIARGTRTFLDIAGPHARAEEIRALVEAAADRDADTIGRVRQLIAINASPDRTRALASVTAPTLVVHGLVDPLVSYTGGVATARAIPGSRLLMFPDMGHDIPRPRYGEILDAIAANAARAV